MKGMFNNALSFAGGDLISKGLGVLEKQFTTSVSAARDAIATEAQLNAVLKSTGEVAGQSAADIETRSRAMMKASTYDDDEITKAQALLLTFTNVRGVFAPATQAILDMSVAMGQDLQSSTVQIGKALNDPIKGITALTRVGVTFTEQQKEQIKTLVDSGHTLDAQKIIIGELNKEFGGSAQAARDSEGAMAKLKNVYDDTTEAAGRFVIGGLNKITSFIEDHGDDFSKYWNKIKPAFEEGEAFVETKIGGVIDTFKTMYNMFSDVVSLIDDVVHGRWKEAFGDLKKIAEDIMRLLVDNLAVMFGTIPNLLIEAVNQAIKAVDSIKIPKKVFGIDVPGGGGGLNIPEIPKIDLPKFDIGSFVSDVSAAAGAASGAAPHIKGFNEAVIDSGDGAGKSGKKVDDAAKKLEEAMQRMRDSVDSAMDDNVVSFEEFTNINKQALKDGLEPLTAAYAGHLEASRVLSTSINGNAEESYNLTKNLTKLQDVMKTSSAEATKLGVSFVQDFLGKIKSGFSSLFGAPTKEEATLDLQIAQVQQRIAGFNAASGGQDISAALAPDNALLANLQRQKDLMSANNDVMQKQFVLADQTLLTDKMRNDQALTLIGNEREFSTWISNNTTDLQRLSPEVQGLKGDLANLRQYLATLMSGGSNDLRLAARGV